MEFDTKLQWHSVGLQPVIMRAFLLIVLLTNCLNLQPKAAAKAAAEAAPQILQIGLPLTDAFSKGEMNMFMEAEPNSLAENQGMIQRGWSVNGVEGGGPITTNRRLVGLNRGQWKNGRKNPEGFPWLCGTLNNGVGCKAGYTCQLCTGNNKEGCARCELDENGGSPQQPPLAEAQENGVMNRQWITYHPGAHQLGGGGRPSAGGGGGGAPFSNSDANRLSNQLTNAG